MKQNKRRLIVATVGITIKIFLIPHIDFLVKQGQEIHIMCNIKDLTEEDIQIIMAKGATIHHVNFSRNVLSFKNLKAVLEVKNILTKHNFDVIDTHTPNASFIVRFVARKQKSKVNYFVHGYHFHRGASMLNWLLIFPLEYISAHWTDNVITINEEDYLASYKMPYKNRYKIHGIGLDLTKFTTDSHKEFNLRKKLNIPQNSFIITSVGRLDNNKNQIYFIKVMESLLKKDKTIHYVIIGNGPNYQKIKNYIEKNKISENVHLVGFQKNIKYYLKESNLHISVSKREGLPINVLEAMSLNKCILLSDIRGHQDLLRSSPELLLNIRKSDKNYWVSTVIKLKNDKEMVDNFTKKYIDSLSKYDVKSVLNELCSIKELEYTEVN